MNYHSQRGMTLTESLIAMTIVAMVVAIAAPLLQMIVTTSARAEGLQRTVEQERTTFIALRQAFTKAIVPLTTNGDVVFSGTARELRFFAYDETGAVQQLTLSKGNDHQGASLLLELAPSAREANTATRNGKITLLTDLSDLSLSYYGALMTGTPAVWRQNWSGTRLPRLVRITTIRQINGGERKKVIDLRVPTEGALVCPFDPVSRQCREET